MSHPAADRAMSRAIGSLLAALATVVPLAGVTVSYLVSYSGVDLAGNPDDAPYRAAFALLVLGVPIGFLSALAYFPAVTWILERFGRYSIVSLLLAGVLSATGAGLLFYSLGEGKGLEGSSIFSIQSALFVLASLIPGSLIWWRWSRA